MPYHVRPLSRREVLRGSLGLGLGALLGGCASYPVFHGLADPRAAAGEDLHTPERWVLLSDTHISADPDCAVGPVNMAEHLREAVSAVLAPAAGPPSPTAGVIVNGDCALEHGRPGDYCTFADLLVKPVVAGGLPLHLNLGNHDHRGHFRGALCGDKGVSDLSCVQGRYASLVSGRYANWFLLDTLDDRYLFAGGVGSRQLAWLDQALRQHNDRPAFVVGHHPLDPEYDLLGHNTSLLDAGALWNVLTRHPHVKAYLFGHTHRWYVSRRQGIYLINLPSTAYTFDQGQPHGWVEMCLGPGAARLRLHHVGGETPEPAARDADLADLRWA